MPANRWNQKNLFILLLLISISRDCPAYLITYLVSLASPSLPSNPLCSLVFSTITMNSHQLKLLTILSFNVLVLLALGHPLPCDFPAVINFGDSNSDTGGLSATFRPTKPPNGETFFKMPAGRFSDGRLIIDFIAESLGFPYLSAYLDSLGANFSHGANFATAGSTILPQNQSLALVGYSPFSLDIQLRQFFQFESRSQVVYKRGGVFKDLMPKEEYFSRALYTFDIGQNDLTQGSFSNKSVEEYVPDAMKQFSSAVKSIYEKGGRSFWIHNTGPLGCLPYALLRVPLKDTQVDPVGCEIPYNHVARQFNQMLNETVAQLRRELPLAAITYVDVYSAKYLLISQAAKYGFEHPLMSCCGYGGGAYNYNFNIFCGDTTTVNGTEVLLGKSCEEPMKRIIWDGAHYTEAANKWVFDQIYSGAFSDPPVPLNMACHKQGT